MKLFYYKFVIYFLFRIKKNKCDVYIDDELPFDYYKDLLYNLYVENKELKGTNVTKLKIKKIRWLLKIITGRDLQGFE